MKKKPTFWQSICGFFSDTSPFMSVFGQFFFLVTVNLCWLVCSLPLVTAGAASAALYQVLHQRESLHYGSAFLLFFQTFRRRFWPATLAWLPFLLAGGLLIWDFRLLSLEGLTNSLPALTPLLLAGSVWGLTLEWLFPVLSRLDRGAWQSVRTAFLLGLGELWRSLTALALDLAPLALLLFFPEPFLKVWWVWPLAGFAVLALLKLLLLAPPLERLANP